MGLQRKFFGKETGNFQFSHANQRSFFTAIRRVRKNIQQVTTIFSPACGFTSRILSVSEDSIELRPRHFVLPTDLAEMTIERSNGAADGGIAENDGQAIAIFNADCPVTAIFDKEHSRLGVLHTGFRSLVPENPVEPNIIEALFAHHGFISGDVEAFLGFGIGPCCYGAEHFSEVQRGTVIRSNGDEVSLPLAKAIRGPRKGQTAVDLYTLIRSELLRLGVHGDQIMINKACTACAGRERGGAGLYYSNTWEGKATGRNAVLVWFT